MAIRVLVLSEDTGRDAVLTFKALLKRIVNFYDQGREAVVVRPGEERDFPRVGSNFWREHGERSANARLQLCRSIATALALGDVVLFHSDADATWEAQHEGLTKAFDDKIRTPAGRLLGHTETRNNHQSGWAEARLQRLIHVVPTWSVEAWTYQATHKAVELCETKYGRRDVALFASWEADRALLDEVVKPKTQTCLGNKHNAELAAAVPAAEVLALGKSFTRFVESLRALAELSDRMRC